jgi:cell wall-associated NlpC family hydrolase
VRRLLISLAALAVLLGAGIAWSAVAASSDQAEPARAEVAAVPTAAAVEDAPDPLPPLPKPRPKVVQPIAGEAAGTTPQEAVIPEESDPDGSEDRAPTRAASRSRLKGDRPASGGDAVRDATALPNGVALPPLEAPEAVLRIIEAGNSIARTPYKWGGGHGKWQDTGYDCSGSVSFALASAGLLGGPLASGPFMSWGKPGKGKWVTIYTNPGHMFMEVAGIRFDTSGARRTGSRWQNDKRPTSGFVARHPPGL